MNKRKIKEIVKFSLRRNIQNKWFIILNSILFALIVIFVNAKNISNFLESKNINLFNDEFKIFYIDNENLIGDSLENAFKENPKIEVEKVQENNYDKDNIENNVVVEVFSNKEEILKAKIISNEGIDGNVYNTIIDTLNDKRTEFFSIKKNIQKSELENLERGISVERLMLGVDSENSDKKEMIQYISTMIVYMVSIFIFSKIANEIAQEKVSKSIEYVLTSVSAKEYLLAKIISIVLVVLLQGIYLLVYYFIGNILNNFVNMTYFESNKIKISGALSNIDIDLLKYILIVFIYGILTIVLMAIIQAALSSKTTSMQEAGNSMMFLLTITIAVYILTFTLITPYTNMSIWIYIVSCIPLISNYFIPAIIVIGQATTLQIVVSLVLLIVSIPVAFNICSNVFKNGVLDYKQNKNMKRKTKKELTLLEEQELKLEKTRFRRLGFVSCLAIILFIVIELIANFLLELFVVPILSNYINETAVDLIYQIIVSCIGLGLASYFVHLFISKKEKNVLDLKSTKKLFICSIFLVGILQIVLSLMQMLLGIENNVSELLLDIKGLDNPLNCILFFIEIAVAPAIFEELFFRKSMIDLSRDFGDRFAIVFSSIIFGVSHLNFSQAIFAFLMGLVLGTLYLKTGTMKYNILLHLLNNGFAAITEILFFNEFKILTLLYTVIILTLLILAGSVFIDELIRKIKNKEKINWFDGKIVPKNIKYIFTDYTVIITIIFTGLLFAATEVVLKYL